jgi:uncharacterized protein (DUF983 family)
VISAPQFPKIPLAISPIAAGLRGVCPRCARASIFKNLLVVRDVCPACALPIKEFDLGDGAIVLVILFGGGLVTGLGVWAQFNLGLPDWLLLALFLPFAALVCIGLLRPFKATLLAMIYHHKAGEGRLD